MSLYTAPADKLLKAFSDSSTHLDLLEKVNAWFSDVCRQDTGFTEGNIWQNGATTLRGAVASGLPKIVNLLTQELALTAIWVLEDTEGDDRALEEGMAKLRRALTILQPPFIDLELADKESMAESTKWVECLPILKQIAAGGRTNPAEQIRIQSLDCNLLMKKISGHNCAIKLRKLYDKFVRPVAMVSCTAQAQDRCRCKPRLYEGFGSFGVCPRAALSQGCKFQTPILIHFGCRLFLLRVGVCVTGRLHQAFQRNPCSSWRRILRP